MREARPPLMPVLFVSHGAPTVALEEGDYAASLRRFADSIPLPSAIVVVSAHWQTRWPIRVTGSRRPSLIHDFSGFPRELYTLEYPAPGSPALAARIVELLNGAERESEPVGSTGIPGAVLDRERGWDHGLWVPLRIAFPAASIPVVEVSLPAPAEPARLAWVGRALAPLRAEGVLLIGSGGVVHNLRRIRFEEEDLEGEPVVDRWAREFDDWVRARLDPIGEDELLDYRRAAPHADLAVPTTEHFDPLLVAIGARGGSDHLEDVHAGFRYANLSMRCFAFRASAADRSQR